MGIRNLLGMGRYERAIQAAQPWEQYAPPDPNTFPLATPWGSSELQRVVFEDIFGADRPVNSREAAMRIPAAARARNLMVSAIARNPLVTLRGDTRTPDQPVWMYRSDVCVPQLRMAWTVDDLIWYGRSLWWRINNADGSLHDAQRVPVDEWGITDDLRVEVNGVPVTDPTKIIVFQGIHEGVLSYGVDAVYDARALYVAVRKRLKNPIPGIDLHQTGGRPMTDPEIDALIARWAAARDGQNGSVGYTSADIEAKPLTGGDDGALMIDARNAAAVDIARMIGVSASLVDATAPKASLNYETTAGRNVELIDRDTPVYADPIAWRLSADDVCPRGQRVAFDREESLSPAPTTTGPTLED